MRERKLILTDRTIVSFRSLLARAEIFYTLSKGFSYVVEHETDQTLGLFYNPCLFDTNLFLFEDLETDRYFLLDFEFDYDDEFDRHKCQDREAPLGPAPSSSSPCQSNLPPTQFESRYIKSDYKSYNRFKPSIPGRRTQMSLITKSHRSLHSSVRHYSVKLQKPNPPISEYHVQVYKKVKLLGSLCSQ